MPVENWGPRLAQIADLTRRAVWANVNLANTHADTLAKIDAAKKEAQKAKGGKLTLQEAGEIVHRYWQEDNLARDTKRLLEYQALNLVALDVLDLTRAMQLIEMQRISLDISRLVDVAKRLVTEEETQLYIQWMVNLVGTSRDGEWEHPYLEVDPRVVENVGIMKPRITIASRNARRIRFDLEFAGDLENQFSPAQGKIGVTLLRKKGEEIPPPGEENFRILSGSFPMMGNLTATSVFLDAAFFEIRKLRRS